MPLPILQLGIRIAEKMQLLPTPTHNKGSVDYCTAKSLALSQFTEISHATFFLQGARNAHKILLGIFHDVTINVARTALPSSIFWDVSAVGRAASLPGFRVPLIGIPFT